MTDNGTKPHQSRGSRKTESEAEITHEQLEAAPTFVRASQMPRSDHTDPMSVEARIENAIDQLGHGASDTDDDWLAEALAEEVAVLERLWALAEEFEYTDGDSV